MKYLKCKKGYKVDVKSMKAEELSELSCEIREAILNRVSKKGGHCGSNLGFVEGTIALHRVFNPSHDRLVFDVSHQSYVHKILSARAYAFLEEEHFTDITGYTNPAESEDDVFITGHTSTSLSTSLGLAIARDRKKTDEKIVAIIGDGSLSGGLALEALNAIGEYRGQLLVIVNDNDMSISENHGGIYRSLAELRCTQGRSSNNIFRSFGIGYEYLQDGNDVIAFTNALERLKDRSLPVVLHVCTQKGCGYPPAVKDKEGFHFKMPFDIKTGLDLVTATTQSLGEKTYNYISSLIEKGGKIQVLNAATASTLAMDKPRRDKLGANYTDFGIAEGCMVSAAAGIAKGGAVPVVPVYSTFLNRAYDQIFHDVCINALPVVFLIFSSSLFAMRDVSHNGHFTDVLVSNLPNLTLLSPAGEDEYFEVLKSALAGEYPAAVAIKVPENPISSHFTSSLNTKAAREVISGDSSCALIAVGDTLGTAEKTHAILLEKGVSITLLSSLVASADLDSDYYKKLFDEYSLIAVLDYAPLFSGFASKLAVLNTSGRCKLLPLSYPNKFTDGYEPEEFLRKNSLDAVSAASRILSSLGR